MKLPSPQVLIPWEDTLGVRQYSRLDFNGTVDIRRVRRMLRRFCKHHLGTSVKKDFLMYHIKRAVQLKAGARNVTPNKSTLEAFIKALEMSDEEYNAALLEADSQAATSVQDDGGPREAEREVSTVQSGPDEDGTQEPLCGS